MLSRPSSCRLPYALSLLFNAITHVSTTLALDDTRAAYQSMLSAGTSLKNGFSLMKSSSSSEQSPCTTISSLPSLFLLTLAPVANFCANFLAAGLSLRTHEIGQQTCHETVSAKGKIGNSLDAKDLETKDAGDVLSLAALDPLDEDFAL